MDATAISTRFSYYLLQRARRATKGVCLICGASPVQKSWVENTSARLCTGHPERETLQAVAALQYADRESA